MGQSEEITLGEEGIPTPHPRYIRELRCIKIDEVYGEVDGELYSEYGGEIDGNRKGQTVPPTRG